LVLRRDGLVAARVDFFAGAAFAGAALRAVVFFTALVAVFFAGAEALVAFVERPAATRSRKPLPGRKAGTAVFGTRTDSPVRGLRAIRGPRSRFSKTPKPVIETLSPLVTAF